MDDRKAQHAYSHDVQRQHSSSHHTSSAFSPSANANEDWTKISDLAERRRIQNRIAQRNYRKKLKKRLEDLERRAGSSSASPEAEHKELPYSESPESDHTCSSHNVSTTADTTTKSGIRKNSSSATRRTSDDRSMFSRQHLRQLSTSPPPFSCPAYSSYELPTISSYTAYPTQAIPPQYSGQTTQSFPAHVPSVAQRYSGQWQQKAVPVKQEYYGEDEMSPFSMSYASMAGIEIPYGAGYQEQPMIHTPELSDTYEYEYSSAGSPEDDYSFTLLAMPLTPPLQPYER